jgi:GT2 family glycosyltransferase
MSSEVIVVDNGSHDGSARMVQEEFQHVRLIKNQQNQGFAHATNQGVERARGAYVLFLNSDAVVTGNAVKQMVAFLEENVRYGAVAPRLLDPSGATERAHMRFPKLWTPLFSGTPLERWSPRNWEIRRYFAHDFDYEKDGDVEQPSAACLLMRRKALKKTKPLDEALRIAFTDVDLAKRLAAAGWKIGYLADAHVYHHGAMSVRQYADFVREWHRNRLHYYRRHHGRIGAAVVKTAVAWSVADHTVREFWRRAHGMQEEPLLPVWNALTALLRT